MSDDDFPYVREGAPGWDSYLTRSPYDEGIEPNRTFQPKDWCDVRPCPKASGCVKCWCTCESEVLTGPCPIVGHPHE